MPKTIDLWTVTEVISYPRPTVEVKQWRIHYDGKFVADFGFKELADEYIARRNARCDDCRIVTPDRIVKGDHHGGLKSVCRDRDACNHRSPG